MTYRRDIQVDEQIPLPIETVYNSMADSLKSTKADEYYHGHDEYFNKLHFKYPPEWKTSNIGEMIIGVRNMTINWRDGELRFRLFIGLFNDAAYERKLKIYNSFGYEGITDEEKHQITIGSI